MSFVGYFDVICENQMFWFDTWLLVFLILSKQSGKIQTYGIFFVEVRESLDRFYQTDNESQASIRIFRQTSIFCRESDSKKELLVIYGFLKRHEILF